MKKKYFYLSTRKDSASDMWFEAEIVTTGSLEDAKKCLCKWLKHNTSFDVKEDDWFEEAGCNAEEDEEDYMSIVIQRRIVTAEKLI